MYLDKHTQDDKPCLASHSGWMKSGTSGKELSYLNKLQHQTRFVKVYGIPGVKKFTMVVTNDFVATDMMKVLVNAGYGYSPEKHDHYYRAADRCLKQMSK